MYHFSFVRHFQLFLIEELGEYSEQTKVKMSRVQAHTVRLPKIIKFESVLASFTPPAAKEERLLTRAAACRR